MEWLSTNSNIWTFGGNYLASLESYYNPLGLPAFTIRLRYPDGVTPTFRYGTAVQVTASPNVWDLTYNNTNWNNLLSSDNDLVEVLGANTTGVTYMSSMLYHCSNLETCAVFDTRSVTLMGNIMDNCSSLLEVPPFDTSKVEVFQSAFIGCVSLDYIPMLSTASAVNVNQMFAWCKYVYSGALAMYNSMKNNTNITDHYQTFYLCGCSTPTGHAELAQIPVSWVGEGGYDWDYND